MYTEDLQACSRGMANSHVENTSRKMVTLKQELSPTHAHDHISQALTDIAVFSWFGQHGIANAFGSMST